MRLLIDPTGGQSAETVLQQRDQFNSPNKSATLGVRSDALLVVRDGRIVYERYAAPTRAEIHGVMSFYHDFREQPAGQHVLKLCRAEACQAMGADRVAAHAQKALGIDFHETTRDGKVTLEPIFCLGLCACAPAAMVDGRLVGRVDEAAVDAILAEVRA